MFSGQPTFPVFLMNIYLNVVDPNTVPTGLKPFMYVLAFISSSLISLNISTLLHSLQDLMTGKCQDICLKPKYFNS